MANLITEVERMKQLAGIPPAASQATKTINTSDEKKLEDAIKQSSYIKSRLENIGTIQELDGFFKTVLSFTSIDDISKTNLITALRKAMEDINPGSPTITTKKG